MNRSFVALRFLAQGAYERAGGLDVEPKEDAEMRIFVLFCRVSAENAGARLHSGGGLEQDCEHGRGSTKREPFQGVRMGRNEGPMFSIFWETSHVPRVRI